MKDWNTPQSPSPTPDATDAGAAASPIRVERILTFLKKYWWVPVLSLVCALAVAVIYSIYTPPVYISRGSLWETEKLRLPEGAAFTDDFQNYLGTQIELLRSAKLSQLAMARLQAGGTNAIPLGSDGKPLKIRLNVGQVPKSTVLMLEASSAKPAYSQAFLTALMTELLEYKKNIRKLVSGDTLASISDQVLRLEKDLKNDQEALTAFQRTNNLAILAEEGAVAGGYLTRLKTQLSDLKLEAQLLEATALEHDWAASNGTNTPSFVVDSVRAQETGASSTVTSERQTAFKELELLKIQQASLAKYLRPKHPKMIKLAGDIEKGEKLVQMYHNQTREQLADAAKAAKMKIDSVQASIKEWETKVVESNGRIAEAERLKLGVNRSQSLYDRLVILLQNVDISRNIDQENLAILEPASIALRSYKQELVAFSLALLAGLAVGIGIVCLVEMRDDRFTSLGEVTEKFGDNIVGQVPEMPQPVGAPLPLLEKGDRRHMYAEAYRNLRSALLYLPVQGERPKVLLVTSALPNEGKSTVAANLARTLAQGGSKVLLIDGDLRRGRLHEMMGFQSEPGLAELIQEPTELSNVIQSNCQPNLTFISRGKSSTTPADLFLSPNLEAILFRCRQHFDHVLIDSCPVFAADDATTLAPKVDGTLFVVRNRFTSATVVKESLSLFFARQARVLGLVFNRADSSARSYHYYKHKEYYIEEQNA